MASDPPPDLPGTGAEYSSQERAWLLRLAHQAIQASLRQLDPAFTPLNEHLAEPRGAFTTLHLGGELRGCVGYVLPVHPLYRTIAETAVAAAFSDTRFEPVTGGEAARLKIEISVMSPMFPIAPEAVEVGKHGLLVSFHGVRGLLLPQVPIERGWDRETFLAQTCRKAGLSPEAWRLGATFEAFTAEVFGE